MFLPCYLFTTSGKTLQKNIYTYDMLDIKFYKKTYIIHIYIYIFSTKLEQNWYKCL